MSKKENKREEKKQRKKEEKHRRKLRSTLEWMDIEGLDHNGIYLKRDGKLIITRGLRLTPINIHLLTDAERKMRILRYASAIDKLYQYKLYFKFIKNEPETIMQTSRFLKLLEQEENESIASLLQIQIDKLEWFRTYNREVKFFVMIQEDESHIDKAFDLLRREFGFAWGSSDLVKPMTYLDYKSLIQQEFENDYVDEYFFTQAVLPDVSPLELQEQYEKENTEKTK